LKASKFLLPASVALLSLTAAVFCYRRGILNLHYDGVAHLNIARRVLDHPVPHYSHLGTVWLPVQHLLLLPWVQSDFLWSEGLAGTVISVTAFWVSCYYLFRLSSAAHRDKLAAVLPVAAFATNPNVLYLQSTPLGEMLYIAFFLATLFYLHRLAEQPWTSVFPAAGATVLASLTRYDAWVLVPGGAVALLWTGRRQQRDRKSSWTAAATYLLLGSAGILGWLAYNQLAFDDPFSFARGAYSTERNIERIISEAGVSAYPPFLNLFNACLYYAGAALLSAGAPLLILGCLGFVRFSWHSFPTGRFWILGSSFFFPPLFYIANMIKGTGIIFIPSLPPYGILNVRYTALFIPGLCLFFPQAIALAAHGLQSLMQRFRPAQTSGPILESGRLQSQLGVAALFGVLIFWGMLTIQGREAFAFYQEAYVNGFERKQTDFQAAAFLKANYDQTPILMDLSQHGIVPQRCRIPLVRIVNEATDWRTVMPTPSRSVKWIVAQEGDGVASFPVNWEDVQQHFNMVFEARSPFEKPLRIYRQKQ
jgi:hypothetical protein